MKNRHRWILSMACVLILCGSARLRAQVAEKGKDEANTIKALVEEAVGWYRVFIDASAAEAMTPHRVLRWRNATRGTRHSEGVFVLWVHKGRPEASASIYPWEGNLTLLEAVRPNGRPRWQFAFARATAAGLEARIDKTAVWAVDFLVGDATPRTPQMTLRRPLGTIGSGR